MRAFADIAAKHPHTVTPALRHIVYKSAFFMTVEEHNTLVTLLNAELEKITDLSHSGIRVIVSGILLEPFELLETFRDLDIVIAGDDLAQQSRQYRVDVPADKDPLRALSRMWQMMYGCSLAYEKTKSRLSMLVDMQKQYGADGVVIAMMKFCDPEEFDYPLIKKELDAARIPLLNIEIDQQLRATDQLRTRLQSFAEMIAANAGM
jgi:benzoyl-CoA reductase/2-hydroxyglutaryl-CoA dehydratase subunit BcrC/BadD/HgdB